MRPEEALPQGAAVRWDDGALCLMLSADVYSLDAILRTCYWLTDRCYVHIARPDNQATQVTLLAKAPGEALTDALAWQFLNDLLDQQLRVAIQRETATVRDLIVAQAFSDVDVIDDKGRPVTPGTVPFVDEHALQTWRPAL